MRSCDIPKFHELAIPEEFHSDIQRRDLNLILCLNDGGIVGIQAKEPIQEILAIPEEFHIDIQTRDFK